MDLKNATVFVTGGNRGLGLGFVKEAVARGAAKVYAGMRTIGDFAEPGVTAVTLDVTDAKSVETAAAACSDVDILINNAGIAAVLENALDGDFDKTSRHLFETNYYGLARTTQAFAPGLRRRRKAAIINVLSNASWLPVPRLTAYAATKAAAWSYTNHARLYFNEFNIQVLALHVGYVDTDLTKRLDVPKTSVADVVSRTFDALVAGQNEVFADEGTRALKATLSSDKSGYIDPSPFA